MDKQSHVFQEYSKFVIHLERAIQQLDDCQAAFESSRRKLRDSDNDSLAVAGSTIQVSGGPGRRIQFRLTFHSEGIEPNSRRSGRNGISDLTQQAFPAASEVSFALPEFALCESPSTISGY